MAKLSRDDVLKLARLARLRLSEDEVEKYRNELVAILGYVEKLDSVDLSGYEPTYQVNKLVNVTRPDELIDYGTSQQSLLANAPEELSNQIKVKRMVA